IGRLQVLGKSPLLLAICLLCGIPGAVYPTEIPAGLEEEQNGPSDVEFFVYGIRRTSDKGAVQGKRRYCLEWFPGIEVTSTGEDAREARRHLRRFRLQWGAQTKFFLEGQCPRRQRIARWHSL